MVTKSLLTTGITKEPIKFDWSKKFGIDVPSFGGLDEHQIDRISDLLPKKFMENIKEIANKDKTVQTLYEELKQMPDMTEEEREAQSIEFNKTMIEHGEGFIEWERREREWMKNYSEENKKKVLKKIEILRKWAIENNMMKPALERLKEQ